VSKGAAPNQAWIKCRKALCPIKLCPIKAGKVSEGAVPNQVRIKCRKALCPIQGLASNRSKPQTRSKWGSRRIFKWLTLVNREFLYLHSKPNSVSYFSFLFSINTLNIHYNLKSIFGEPLKIKQSNLHGFITDSPDILSRYTTYVLVQHPSSTDD